ncbi:MAG: hypothetical protein PUP93_20395 [Rhizonema sp. NSF051]|nr:hypothetical protein [Rhizonema sp. NSF051]
MDKKRDRISVDLGGLRKRIEEIATEPDQSIASVVRRAIHLGIDLLEACQRLKLPPPRLGAIEEWLVDISGIQQKTSNGETLSVLLSKLSIEEISESGIPFDRILAIKQGDEPEPHEVTKLARILQKTPSQIRQIVKEKQCNGVD